MRESVEKSGDAQILRSRGRLQVMSSKPNFAVSGNRQWFIARSHPSVEPGDASGRFVRHERSLNTKKV
jgi:hypothetical protein